MRSLHVSLFGQVHIQFDTQAEQVKLTRLPQALLTFLLIHRRRVFSREVLIEQFWGESSREKAHSCLNTTLWRLRCALEPEGVEAGTYLLGHHSGEIGFNRDAALWLDIEVFEEQAARLINQSFETVQPQDIQRLETVLALYRGELLEDYFDDWALRERERLRMLYLNALAYLMQYRCKTGEREQAVTLGRRILEMDPLREEIHREIMRLYLADGKRALALQQYEQCQRALREELAIEPVEETRALYHAIQKGSLPASSPVDTAQRASIQDTLRDLHRTAEMLEQMSKQVWQAIYELEASSALTSPGKKA